MDEQMRLASETTFELFDTDLFLRHSYTPLRDFEDEMIEGPMLDIGCGQTTILLDYVTSNRKLFALDNDEFQLTLLKQRIEQLKQEKGNWEFLNLNFPNDPIPKNNYSAIILSNILHFFSLEECIKIEGIIDSISVANTLIYVSVHSSRYYANNPEDPENNEYFKHYFELKDFDSIFPSKKYTRIYQAEIEKASTRLGLKIIDKWLDKVFAMEGIKNPRVIAQNKKEYLKNKNEADIQLVFRKL